MATDHGETARELEAAYFAEQGINATPGVQRPDPPKSRALKETEEQLALYEERKAKYGKDYAAYAKLYGW